MPQSHDYIYFLQSKDRKFWGINAGTINLSNNPYPLLFSPDGWLDTTVENIRNKKYWGIDRTASAPFKYVEDGAAILKHVFYKKGVEEQVYLVICEQKLHYSPAPTAVIAAVSGSIPFTNGTNTGTITGQPGETIKVKISITGLYTDTLFGNLGSNILVNKIGVDPPTVYTVTLPPSGVINYNFFFNNGSTTAVSTIVSVNADGSATGEYGYWYKQIIRTEIDLSTFNHTGAYVTAATIEEGIAKHLRANENTVYELLLNVPEAVTVKMDGILLTMRQNYSFLNDYIFGSSDIVDAAVSLTKTTNEGRAPYVSLFDLNYELFAVDNSPFKYVVESPNFFLKNTGPVAIAIQITGKLRINISDLKDASSLKMMLWNVEADATEGNAHWTMHDPLTGAITPTGHIETFSGTGIHEWVFNSTITVQPGARLYLEMDRDPFAEHTDLMEFKFETDSTLSFFFNAKFQTTYSKWLRPQYILEQLIIKMTGGEYTADDCPYFNSFNNWDKVFSSGDGIRGLTDAKLKISFSQFFDFWNVYDEVGISEKNARILLDRKKNLVDMVNRINLGEAAKAEISFDKELPFNELLIGYPDLFNEDGFVNGKNEFNTTSSFSLGTTKTPRKYEKTTSVRASCYDIENTRILSEQRDSTDNKNDNENYVLHIDSTLVAAAGDIPAHYSIDRTLNSFIAGVDQADSVFNIIFSPKRCMKRSGDYLRSILYLSDNKTLKFISNFRNGGMSYSNGSDVVVENADENVGQLGEKFFYPVIITAEINPPEDMLDDLDEIPIRGFELSFDGQPYKLITVKNSINPKANKTQTWESWSAADNDLPKLIEYYG